MFLLWLRQFPDVGIVPVLQFPHLLRAGQLLLALLFSPLVPSSYRALHGPIYSFHWSGTPVRSQLVFCMHFWVWRCIPDVSMERDVLHIYLLLCHLVLPFFLSSFILISWRLITLHNIAVVFAWFYIFFCAGQGLLSTLSRCSACTYVSEGVFLVYLWREMCSMSTHSPAILFSPL